MTVAAQASPALLSPPSPPRHFLLGHLPELRDVIGYYERCKRQYGDVVQFSLAGWNAYLVSDPALVEEVLVTKHRNFTKHRFFWRHVRSIFGKGLLTSEGNHWVQQRKLIQPAFHRERINGYGRIMVERIERMLERWRDGETRDLHDDMMHVTMEIVARALFGADVSDAEATAVGDAFDVAIEQIAIRFQRPFLIPDWVPVPNNVRYNRAVRELDRLIYGFIRARKGAEEGDDLLSMLLAARDDAGNRMTDEQLRDELVTLFLAGHETTAIALSWTAWLLATNPDAQTKLQEEVDRVLGDAPLSPEILDRFDYTRRVVLEGMRLYPPAYGFGREAIADCEIGGYRIGKGSTVFMFPWILHRDERWFADPLRFDPDRWKGDLERKLPPFAYMPFGGGPRRCIGNSFAMMEAVLLLAAIAQRFRLEVAPGHRVVPFPSITLRPKYGMKMTLHARGTGQRS